MSNEFYDLGKRMYERLKPAVPIKHIIEQRPWVGLTDEEIWTVLQFRGYNSDTIEIAKAIEAKLKEKNG